MSVSGHDAEAKTAQTYRAFIGETHGRSSWYGELALAVSEDEHVLGFLGTLPPAKRQPNLLFAAARYLLGEPATITTLRALATDRAAELTDTMLTRRTQTNEPARCATLLPALALLPQPLALLEVGASAGLTLLADKYSYDYAGHLVTGTDPRAPVLRCQPRGPVPLPDRVPVVAWRAGLDLNPLDVADDDDVRWLECLLWPGESDRGARLAAAIESARRHPPVIHSGDLLTDVPALVSEAPREATLVIFHSAVLAYVSRPQRIAFARTMQDLGAIWLSNEAPGVVPGTVAPGSDDHAFLLIRDGAQVIARTDPHGAWLDWQCGV